jgi:RNA polymerase sigma factor (sigma-70 family)
MMATGWTAGVERLGAGRSESLEDLYEQHIEWAESLAFLLTRDPHLAEDLAQEAFIRVAGRLRHIRRPEAFRAYLRRTLLNTYRNHFRRVEAERRALVRDARETDPIPLYERKADPELLAALPTRQRAAVVLRYYEDLSEEQTAVLLRCSKRAVNALISRALDTLRREMRRDDE